MSSPASVSPSARVAQALQTCAKIADSPWVVAVYVWRVATWNSFTPQQLLAFTHSRDNQQQDDAPLLALGISVERLSEWELEHSEIESHDGHENLLWCRTILRHTGDDNARSTLWAYLWPRPAGDRWLVTNDFMPVQVHEHTTLVVVYTPHGEPGTVVDILGTSRGTTLALAGTPE